MHKNGTNGIKAAKLEQHKHNEMLQNAPSDAFCQAKQEAGGVSVTPRQTEGAGPEAAEENKR